MSTVECLHIISIKINNQDQSLHNFIWYHKSGTYQKHILIALLHTWKITVSAAAVCVALHNITLTHLCTE